MRLVKPGDFVELRVVAVRPGEFDAQVISGVWQGVAQGVGTVVTVKPTGKRSPAVALAHHHEDWQLQDHPDGGKYCAACGTRVPIDSKGV
jgi:hypothetical protein